MPMPGCRDCGHPVAWGLVLDAGKPARRMKFNPIPTEDGPFVLGPKSPEYRRLEKGEKHEGLRYTPHRCEGGAA